MTRRGIALVEDWRLRQRMRATDERTSARARRRASGRSAPCAMRWPMRSMRASIRSTVRGEISGFSRATSGHCYFALKDAGGQLRCAMFRRAAGLLDFSPRDGDQVEVRGRLAVYEPRGDLQLVVESLRRAGQGALFEQFLQRKAQAGGRGPVRSGPQAAAAGDAARDRPRDFAGCGGAARRGRRHCAGGCRTSRWCWRRRPSRAPARRPSWCGALRVALGDAAAAGRCDPAGARRRLDRGPVGLQRRDAGARDRRKAPCR